MSLEKEVNKIATITPNGQVTTAQRRRFLPYLVLMKIVSSRSQDWADLSRMLGQASEEELNRVRAVIKPYAPEVAEDVESFIYLGQLEMKMPQGKEQSNKNRAEK